jgi:long-chain acyl-CoA synthetase
MEVLRLFDLLPYQLENFPQDDAFVSKVDGVWKKHSSSEAIERANAFSYGLLKLGIKPGDKIAIICPNRPEWNFLDYGIQQIGAVGVPMYPTITEDDYRYIFKDAEIKLVFVGDAEIYRKAKNAASQLPDVKEIFTLLKVDGVRLWSEVEAMGKDGNKQQLESLKSAVKPDDVVTLIYTSGTTGSPKGVMLTHNNLISNFKASQPLMPVDHHHKALSFLPLCHVYERMLTYLYFSRGVSIYYAESIETIGENLKEVKPHIFTTVPRLLEKVYDKIVAKGSEQTGIKKKLFFWALELGLNYDLQGNNSLWFKIQLWFANMLIFSKWRAALGGNIKAIVSGSAPLQPRLARVFWAAKIMVMEGYGLTETSPVISVNRCVAEDNRIGTVGPLIDGVEVKLAEDGEILTRGPHIMKGYYKRPDLTAEVIDKDGWFHTGDIGTFVEGRFLKITDRKKEIFKTSGGKYVAPSSLENKFKESRFIEQMMVVGDGQKFPGALIVPSFAFLKSYCEIKGIPYTSDAEIIKNPEIISRFQKEIDTYNESFAQYEKIKKFALLPKLWTVESGELTPTQKVKRKVITAKYMDLIEGFYK